MSPLTCTWRLPAASLIISVFVGGLMVPPAGTWVSQVGEMIPALGDGLWNEPFRAVARRVVGDREILAVRRAFHALHQGGPHEPALDAAAAVDRDNGLYTYLRLLPALRQEPIDEDLLRQQLASATTAAPARLYLMRERELAETAFRQAGVPPRRAAAAAMRIDRVAANLAGLPPRGWPASHLPVLRELAGRITQYSERSREAGRVAEAVTAQRVVVRLLTGLVEDSPEPLLALTAADLLAEALEQLARDIQTTPGPQSTTAPAGEQGGEPAGAPAMDLAAACRTEADKLRTFHTGWHARVYTEGVPVLPFSADTCHALVAGPAHRRALTSFCMVALVAGTWLGLWLVCLATLPGAVLASAPERGLEWSGRYWSYCLAAALPVAAVLLSGAALAVWPASYAWLTSQPSLQAWAAWPLVTIVLIGVGTRLCLRDRDASLRDPRAGRHAWIMLLALGAAVVLALVLGGWSTESWQPPPAVRRFRLVGWALGSTAAVLLLLSVIRAGLHARRGLTAVAMRGRAYLQVACAALLPVGLLLLLCLWGNQRMDAAHQEAYAQAARRPIGDRLGDAWYQDYFAAARQVADQATPAEPRP